MAAFPVNNTVTIDESGNHVANPGYGGTIDSDGLVIGAVLILGNTNATIVNWAWNKDQTLIENLTLIVR